MIDEDFDAPYDLVADELLRVRGWKSRRDEGWQEHAFDLWTWPPTVRSPRARPTRIQCEGRRFRVFYAAYNDLIRQVQVEYADRDELMADIALIEARG